jgi:hypothetical protein
MKDVSSMGMGQEASVTSNKSENVQLGMIDYFHVECLDADGNFKWKETIKNLVTNEGLSFVVQTCFTGADTKPTDWFVGLKDTGAPAAGDASTDLPSVGNWVEYTEYSESVRQTLTLNAETAQATDNVGNVAAFTIVSPDPDVYGVFVVDSDAKNTNTTATVLYGVGDFGAAKVVDGGDTLNVTVTLSAASAP